MIHYHDTEWGVPLHDDQKIFEFLVLDAFQAGLSWLTVLKKREAFREVFEGFDYNRLAFYTDGQLEEILKNPGIIRNRLKVWSVRKNALAFLKVREELGSFDQYLWKFVNGQPIQNNLSTEAEIPAKTALAEAISKDLKTRGFTFVGPTIVYAFMQAMGMVNDHLTTCFRHQIVAKEV
jgi:DNA-3-methyladenine glycosylase I